jgi:threonine/homoserine/homoserine lactone efflux protein
MIATESLIAYAALAAVLTVTPGPNMALVIRTSLDSGPSGGLLATLGVVSGLAMWALAAALGVAAVLQTVPHAFTVLQAVGGAWLVFLGLRALRSSAPSEVRRDLRTGRHSYSAGLVTNLLNPMVGAFYLAALPGFVPPGPMAPMIALLLAAIHIGMVLIWLSATSVLIGRGTVLLERPQVRQFVQRASAVLIIGFGLRVLATVAL